MFSTVSIFGAVALLAPAVVAQVAPTFSVDDAVRMALVQNPTVLAARQRVRVAEEGERAARPLVNPSFTVSPAITSLSGTTEEVLFVQPLEVNGTRSARVAQAKAERLGSAFAAEGEARRVVYAVKVAYYELAQAREQFALAKELVASAEEFDRIAQRQVELGSRAGIDTAQTGLELARARQQVALAQAEVTAREANLNTLLNRAPGTAVGRLSPLAYAGERVTPDAAMVAAVQNRPELKEQGARESALSAVQSGIRAEGRPDIAPLARVGSVLRPQPNDSGNGFGVGVSISLPIFDYGSRRARLRQAEASLTAQQLDGQATRRRVEGEVIQAVARLQAAEAVIATYRDGVLEKATQLRDASRTGFREGQTNILAVLEAQRSYRAVQNDYIQAVTDALIARADVERATASFSLSTVSSFSAMSATEVKP